MASVAEDFCKFQADCPSSSSVSFGRFEAESLSWEKKSSFSHNRYLEEVEKYSTPGSVTEKKAYFEAHFKRTALRNLIAIEKQNEVDEQAKNGIEDQDTSIEGITEHGNVSANSEDFLGHDQYQIQFSWYDGSQNGDQNRVTETRKEEQIPPSALPPKVRNNNLKASSLESGKKVETATDGKANTSTKSSTMEKVRASSLRKTIRAYHVAKTTVEKKPRITKPKMEGTAGQIEKKISSVNIYSSLKSTPAKELKKIEKEMTLKVKHSSSTASTMMLIAPRNMKLEDSDKMTEKAKAKAGSRRYDSSKKSLSSGHGSSHRDEQLTTTMRLPSGTGTRAFSSKCSERTEQRNKEAKVETKQQVKRLNLKTACTPLSSHKPNPKLICGKKVINGPTHLLPQCRNQAKPPSVSKTVKLQGSTTTSDEHRSAVRSESLNQFGKLEAFATQKQVSGPSKAVGAVKREGDKVKTAFMQRWDAAGKVTQGGGTSNARRSITGSKCMTAQSVAIHVSS